MHHLAGIRPGSYDQKPLLGPSRIAPRIWILNGLGAKERCTDLGWEGYLFKLSWMGSRYPPHLLWNRRGK